MKIAYEKYVCRQIAVPVDTLNFFFFVLRRVLCGEKGFARA